MKATAAFPVVKVIDTHSTADHGIMVVYQDDNNEFFVAPISCFRLAEHSLLPVKM